MFVQLSESSTGARHDVEALARITRGRDVLLVVDAISGAGAMQLETEAWGVDVVVVGSQKALALPPGLAFVSLNARAWERAEAARSPRFYFDLRRERKAQAARSTSPATPSPLSTSWQNPCVVAIVAASKSASAAEAARQRTLGLPSRAADDLVGSSPPRARSARRDARAPARAARRSPSA